MSSTPDIFHRSVRLLDFNKACRNLQDLDPRFREAIKNQDLSKELYSEIAHCAGAMNDRMKSNMTTKDQYSTLDYERDEDPAEMTRVEGVEGVEGGDGRWGRERDLLCPSETVMCDWVGVAGDCVESTVELERAQ